jgi:uncharacterized protein
MINKDVKEYIEKSVLCWLATSDGDHIPNVSPKEIFTCIGDNIFLIANLASPISVKNIKENPNVCVSFVEVFIQKGYKLKGIAKLIDKTSSNFAEKVKLLTDLFTDQFPIQSVIEIEIKKVEIIQAPSYFLYPETTVQNRIESAMETYKVKPNGL